MITALALFRAIYKISELYVSHRVRHRMKSPLCIYLDFCLHILFHFVGMCLLIFKHESHSSFENRINVCVFVLFLSFSFLSPINSISPYSIWPFWHTTIGNKWCMFQWIYTNRNNVFCVVWSTSLFSLVFSFSLLLVYFCKK